MITCRWIETVGLGAVKCLAIMGPDHCKMHEIRGHQGSETTVIPCGKYSKLFT
jgi:hypothetical protein